MKKILLALCLLAGVVYAQNNLPVISNISSSIDTGANTVTLQFDVSDAENDSMEIFLEVSDDTGHTYMITPIDVTGDVGFPEMQGTGKQIVWNYSALTNPATQFRVKIIADDRQTPDIQTMVNMVDTNRLIADMNVIEGVRSYTVGAAHLQEVKDTIYNRMNSLGLNPYIQSFVVGSVTAGNIIGKNPGLVNEEKVYIVDGHFDGVTAGPAADDNGSAVIGVLEIARILSQYQFKNTIRFIGFDLEELGLLGSDEYVTNGIMPEEAVAGVLNFEMIGYYSERPNTQTLPAGFNLLFPAAYTAVLNDSNKGNFITNVANVNSTLLRQKFDQCAATYVPDLRVVSLEAPGNSTIAPDLRRSDHASFWDAGYEALMLTDGANFRNHNYHTANDVSDSLNFEFISKVVKATLATAAELAIPMHAGNGVTDVTIPNMVSGIEDVSINEFQLYPNPADDKVKLTWPLSSLEQPMYVTLTDAQGKMVYQSAPVLQGNVEHTIFTHEFKSGIYFVSLHLKGKTLTSKVVISH